MYLAHIRRTQVTAMTKIMVRRNPQSPFFVNKARVCVDFTKTFSNSVVLQNRLNKKLVRIAHNPQVTPK